MIVACPACQTRYRHRGVPGAKQLNARCSRCNEVFPLVAATAAYRVTAAVTAGDGGAVAVTAGAPPVGARPGPQAPADLTSPAAQPTPSWHSPTVVPAPDGLDLGVGVDVDMPAPPGDTSEEPALGEAPGAAMPASPVEPRRKQREHEEARALPRPAPGPRTPEPRARRSVLRSLFNVVFALIWIGLGAAGGYFGYPGEELEPLIGSSAGAVAGLLAAALMLRWISGRP